MSDMPQAFRQIERKARKEHKCCECRQVIAPGDKYVYSSGIWDGEASDYKQCLICGKAMSAAAAISDPDEAPCFTDLNEWMGNYFYHKCDRDESIRAIARDLKMPEEKIRHVIGKRYT